MGSQADSYGVFTAGQATQAQGQGAVHKAKLFLELTEAPENTCP